MTKINLYGDQYEDLSNIGHYHLSEQYRPGTLGEDQAMWVAEISTPHHEACIEVRADSEKQLRHRVDVICDALNNQ